MEWIENLRPVVAFLYLAVSALFIAGMLGRRAGLKRAASVLAGVGFALHTLGLAGRAAVAGTEALSQAPFYLSLLAWALLLTFFIVRRAMHMEFLALTSAPLALLLYLASLAFTSKVALPKALAGPFLALHIGSLFVSIALLAMAFGAGVIFIHLERKIKTKEKLSGFSKDLPSLTAFDTANQWAVMVGFPLFTLGLVSGFVWGHFTWGKAITWDPKEVVSAAIWVLYAYLFHQRLTAGWRGRKAAKLAILVFVFSLVSLAGVNFLLPTHHSFNQ
ncbi:MAG: cytochrome c biogenesis protein CcsA [Thermodesulfobacteriota bacterium]